MDFDGVDIDNLSQDEILKLYSDTLEDEGDMFIASGFTSGSAYCYCNYYMSAYCSYGGSGYPLYTDHCK